MVNSLVILAYLKYLWYLSFCGFHTFPYMVIMLITWHWLTLDMSNVLLLNGKSYIRSQLSISNYAIDQLWKVCTWSVTKYSVRVKFGSAGPNISGKFSPGPFLPRTKYFSNFWSGLYLWSARTRGVASTRSEVAQGWRQDFSSGATFNPWVDVY